MTLIKINRINSVRQSKSACGLWLGQARLIKTELNYLHRPKCVLNSEVIDD